MPYRVHMTSVPKRAQSSRPLQTQEEFQGVIVTNWGTVLGKHTDPQQGAVQSLPGLRFGGWRDLAQARGCSANLGRD